MRNIKYCPKCNQASTEAISFCPFDGTALIEMQPLQSQLPQQKHVSQPQPAAQSQAESHSTFVNSKKGINPLKILFLLFGMGIVMWALLSLMTSFKNSKGENRGNNTLTASQTPSTTQSSTIPAVSEIDPEVIKSRTSKGEQIYNRISAKYGLPVMFGYQAKNITLMIPTKEWDALSKEDKINLSYFPESLVESIRKNPKPYVNKWISYYKSIEQIERGYEYDGLEYESYLARAANLCNTCWSIAIGTVKGRGFYDDSTPVKGNTAEGFRNSQ